MMFDNVSLAPRSDDARHWQFENGHWRRLDQDDPIWQAGQIIASLFLDADGRRTLHMDDAGSLWERTGNGYVPIDGEISRGLASRPEVLQAIRNLCAGDAGALDPSIDRLKADDDNSDAAFTARKATDWINYGITAAALAEKEIPPARWAVTGLLPEGLTILAGKPKIGKSWLTMALACDVATGGKALDRYPCEAGEVLYLALEDSERRFQDRMAQMGVSPPANMHIRWDAPTLNAGLVDGLRLWLDDHPHTRLVVIDTLARVKPPAKAKQPAYDADTAALAPLQKLAARRGVAVVLIHHQRKERDDDIFDTVSGTLGLTGVADTSIVMAKPRGGGQHEAILNVRGRDVEETAVRVLRDPDRCLWSAADAAPAALPPRQDSIAKALAEAGPDGFTPGELVDRTGLSRSNVSGALKQMQRHGVVEKAKRYGGWVL
ncbi:MAG: AAA family ATPase, partial [Pseudomonadota bacterium]